MWAVQKRKGWAAKNGEEYDRFWSTFDPARSGRAIRRRQGWLVLDLDRVAVNVGQTVNRAEDPAMMSCRIRRASAGSTPPIRHRLPGPQPESRFHWNHCMSRC
jgi:hypothetical protein